MGDELDRPVGRRRGAWTAAFVGMGIVGLLILLFWWMQHGDEGDAFATEQATDPQQDQQLQGDGPNPGDVRADRQEVAEPPDRTDKKSELARVRGRCIAAETGQPLAGCEVRFDGHPGNEALMAIHGKVDWQQPKPVTTGDDGCFEISFVAMPPYQHGLGIKAPGRVPRTARWGAFAPGQVDDLGDVELARGYRVAGTVVDTAGNPVSRATVTLMGLPLPIRSGMAANTRRSGVSDESGRFEIEVPMPAGTWALGARRKGMKQVGPGAVAVGEGKDQEAVRVVLKAMPSISGVCVDEQGRPAVGTYVSTTRGNPANWTDKQGRFVLHAIDEDRKPIRLETSSGDCEPLSDKRAFEWGTTGVRLVLKRALTFELAVVERATGKPVEEFSVVCTTTERERDHYHGARLGGHHAGGKVTVDQVWRGPNRLFVIPKSAELAVSDEVRFEATEAGIPAQRVELDRLSPFQVRVVTRAGAPVPGSTVELIGVGTGKLQPNAYLGLLDRRRGGHSTWRQHELLCRTKSDQHGVARLFVPSGDAELALRARGPHLPAILRPVVFVEGRPPPEIVVAVGGRLTGKIDLRGVTKANASLQLVNRVEGQGREPDVVPVAGNGSFDRSNILPGRYDVVLGVGYSFRHPRGGGGGTFLLRPPLRRVEIVEGKAVELELSAQQFRPGSLEGRVFLDGMPAKAARVVLRPKNSLTRFGQFVPDESGRFVTRLFPGTYGIDLLVGDFVATYGSLINSKDEFVIGAGQTVNRRFDFVRRVMRVQMTGMDGKTPIRNARCYVSIVRQQWTLETDDKGWCTMDPAPCGKVQVSLRDCTPTHTVQIPEDRKESVFRLRFKQNKR